MGDRIALFVILVLTVVVLAMTAQPPARDTLQDARPFDPMGASMRARNQRYAVECSGTVAQRRACWLDLPVNRPGL